MTFLTIAVVVFGSLIAFLIARIPQQMATVLNQQDAKRARVKELEALLTRLREITEQTRVILELAAQRPDFALEPDEIDALRLVGTFCEASLPGLAKASPLLDRYFSNHLAVIRYVLGESDPKATQSDLVNNSLESIYRFFAAQRSNEPIAVMERQLAIGHSV